MKNKTPEQFRAFQKKIQAKVCELEQQLTDARQELEGYAPDPKDLRPMTAADVKPGQIYYGHNSEGWYWNVVEEVRNPACDFKAFVADMAVAGRCRRSERRQF